MTLPSTPYDPLFQEAGEKHGVDPAILKAIASVESDFRPDAVGPKTRSGQAKGMMQFVPATAKAYGLEDPFNPEQSVDAAARLMKDLLKQFDGNVGNALEAYNGGPRLVGKSKQTAAYRQKVLQRAKLADTTQFAQNKRTPMPETTPRVSLSNVADMPAGYKAAIALQYFTDTDPEGNPVDSAEQTLAALREEQDAAEYAQSKPAGGSFLEKFFASKNEGSVSPFDIMAGMQQPEAASTDQGPEQVAQVQGFADGGFAFRGTSLPGMPNPYLNLQNVYTPEEREFLKRQEEAISQYEGGQEGYEKQMADYQAQVDAYNKRMEGMTPQIEAYNKQLSDYEKQLAAYNEQVDLWNKHFVNATPGHEYYYYYLNRNSLNPDAIFASKNPVPTFNAQAPDFGPQPVAPKQPIPAGMTQAQYEQYVNQVNAKQGDIEGRRKQAAQQELALDVVQDPGKYNLAGFGFSQGGDASKQGMLEKVKRFIVENDLTPADFMLTPRTIPLGMMLQPSEANAGEAEELERYRRMAEQARGKVANRSEGSGSRAEEVPQLDQFGRVILPEPEPEPEYSLLEKLYGVGEAAASVASSIPAAVAGSAYGAYKGLTSDKYGTPEGVREAEAAAGDVMRGMTFMPRGEAGQGYTESLSQIIPQELQAAMPQSQLMNLRVNPGAARYLGERAREGTEAAIMPVLRSQMENPNLRPEDVYGAMLGDPAQNIAGAAATYAVRPGGGNVATGSDKFSEGRYFVQTRIADPIFDRVDEASTNMIILDGKFNRLNDRYRNAGDAEFADAVDQVRDAWVGGVADLGDRNPMYLLAQDPRFPGYAKELQSVVKEQMGEEFTGYRLMSKEEFKSLKSGDLGDIFSVSLSPYTANALRNLPKYKGREDLVIAEIPLTPQHVVMLGSVGEREVIIDSSQGWDPRALRQSDIKDSTADLKERLDFIQGPLGDKLDKYLATQYGAPNDPLYKAYMEGRLDINPVIYQMTESVSEASRIARELTALREQKAKALDEGAAPGVIENIDRKMTKIYDELTPFSQVISEDMIVNRLDNQTAKDELVNRIMTQITSLGEQHAAGGAFKSGRSLQEGLKLGTGIVKSLEQANVLSSEGDLAYSLGAKILDHLPEVRQVLRKELDNITTNRSLASSPVWVEALVNKHVAESSLDELGAKISAQRGITSGVVPLTRYESDTAGSTLADNVLGPALSTEAIKEANLKGEATLRPEISNLGNPFDEVELLEYLQKTPLSKLKDQSFPEIVINANNDTAWKQITNPESIARRIDNNRRTTPEQKFTDTVPVLKVESKSIPGGEWRELKSTGAVSIEGRLLKHCLSWRDQPYRRYLEDGTSRFFTLRDKNGQSYVTIEMRRNMATGIHNDVKQIKGFLNASQAKEFGNEITAFLDDYEQKLGTPLVFEETKSFVPEPYKHLAPEDKR